MYIILRYLKYNGLNSNPIFNIECMHDLDCEGSLTERYCYLGNCIGDTGKFNLGKTTV